ncbi:MAG: hypothetical protein MJ246_03650 [Clostridia bacterium]|nr:hypothetical protein [Clostridia bacterium]
MKKYIGIVSIERDRYESGIQAELRTFFSDDKEEIYSWMASYDGKYDGCYECVQIRTSILENTFTLNKVFRPYYDYLAIPVEIRGKSGSEAKNMIESLRRDLS